MIDFCMQKLMKPFTLRTLCKKIYAAQLLLIWTVGNGYRVATD